MPKADGGLGAAMPRAKSAQVSCVPVLWFSFALMENRQHLVDSAAGFLLDAGGVQP